MDILIHSHHLELTTQLHGLVTHRVEHALQAHADHIDRIQVWLSEESTHRGYTERCRLMVHTLPTGMVVVEETCKTQGAAVTKAAADCERAVRRQIERRRDRSTRRVRAA